MTALRRWAFAAVTGLGIFLAAPVPAAGARARPRCRHAQTPVTGASRPELQRAVICLINRERGHRRLPGLLASRRLNRAAQGWTDAMVSHASFGHGTDFGARITAAGFRWSSVGENIAAGFLTPAAVVRAWMASPGHCQNILSPAFADVGIGVSRRAVPGFGGRGTWTQDFGRPASRRPPSGDWGPAQGCPYRG